MTDDGVAGEPGLGPLVVVDIGGSTTDVHSVCDGAPSRSGIVYHGLPEPPATRTVARDLGMRPTARGGGADDGRGALAGPCGGRPGAVGRGG